jgi:hypothetical protein
MTGPNLSSSAAAARPATEDVGAGIEISLFEP